MITLFEQEQQTLDRQSSKGNQLKWLKGEAWYKADYTGYEGLAEYVVSELLCLSNLNSLEITKYQTEQIQYNSQIYLGCVSQNFLKEGSQLFTLERLFKSYYGKSLHASIYQIRNLEERLKFLVDQIIRITGLADFGVYISKLLTIDAFFLNEDRHMHNIAVVMDERGLFHYCPFFDHGASLLSDTSMDYPMVASIYPTIKEARPKTISQNFDEQLDLVEKIYGQHLKFTFTKKDIENILSREIYYSQEIKNRVQDILLYQKKKYSYLAK